MPAGCHVALNRLGGLEVDDAGEEEGLAVLATEVAADNVVERGEVRFAILRWIRGRRLGWVRI
jgi:hypothetical protein